MFKPKLDLTYDEVNSLVDMLVVKQNSLTDELPKLTGVQASWNVDEQRSSRALLIKLMKYRDKL